METLNAHVASLQILDVLSRNILVWRLIPLAFYSTLTIAEMSENLHLASAWAICEVCDTNGLYAHNNHYDINYYLVLMTECFQTSNITGSREAELSEAVDLRLNITELDNYINVCHDSNQEPSVSTLTRRTSEKCVEYSIDNGHSRCSSPGTHAHNAQRSALFYIFFRLIHNEHVGHVTNWCMMSTWVT